MTEADMTRVGVLALQGAVREHAAVLAEIGAEPVLVRRRDQLAQIDAMVLPGGESTTMARLAGPENLLGEVRTRLDDGMPVLGTCAGLILLADRLIDPAALSGFTTVGGLDVDVRRNAYGAQLSSGTREVDLIDGSRMQGVFIRAPRIERVGDQVEVLAELEGTPVAVRQGVIIAAAFHPELSGDARLHELLLAAVAHRLEPAARHT